MLEGTSGVAGESLTRFTILTPVYNDWEAFGCLLQEIEATLPANRYDVQVIAVDDCSATAASVPALSGSISHVGVVRLKLNMGHQRAIAVGLVHVESLQTADKIAVMDADGEDMPLELERMIRASCEAPDTAIVAQRRKRSESLGFRIFYAIYTQVFRALTGSRIDFGNFSVLSMKHVTRLVHNANIWNNFAATLIIAKIPIRRMPTVRGKRYAGRSHMRFVSLITHGLGAISVFSDAVFIRILLASLVVLGAAVAGVILVVGIRLFTDLAVPGWTTNVLGFGVMLSVQAVMLPIMIAFLQLNNRASFQSIPREHAARLIDEVQELYRRPAGEVA